MDRPTVTTFPSYVHTMEYYGTVTSAGCRATVRAAHADKKLPALHSTVGAVLLRCQATSPSHVERNVEHVGVVSSSPFFTQRFGCMAAQVWCCFPPPRDTPPPAETQPSLGCASLSLERSDTCWTAASLLSAPPRSDAPVRFVLAPAEAASTLMRLSASLQRECPPRQRASSRHQRAFDLTRGRTARTLETLLCDPTFCTPVQLIRWYA